MGFLDKIENLQKKPESYRQKVLIISMVVFMAIIVFFWFFTIDLSFEEKETLASGRTGPSRTGPSRTGPGRTGGQAVEERAEKPFSLAWESLKETFSIVKEKIKTLDLKSDL
jgi:hypothetical protein